MGMYDNFSIPSAVVPYSIDLLTGRYQTKSFGNELADVYVCPKTRCLFISGGVGDLPNQRMRLVGVRYVRFYGYDKNKKWIEFDARFDHGVLVKVKRVQEEAKKVKS